MKKLNMAMAAILVAMVAYSAYGSSVSSFAVPELVDEINTALAGVVAAPSVATSASGTTNTVTITAKSATSATIAAKRLVRVWMSETSGGVPSTNNIESVTLSGGAAIQTITAAADYVYLTADTGIASAAVIGTAAGTNYMNVADGGYVTSAAVVFE